MRRLAITALLIFGACTVRAEPAELGIYGDQDATTHSLSISRSSADGQSVVVEFFVVATKVTEPIHAFEFAIEVGGLNPVYPVGLARLVWSGSLFPCGDLPGISFERIQCLDRAPLEPAEILPLIRGSVIASSVGEVRICLGSTGSIGWLSGSEPATVAYLSNLEFPFEAVEFALSNDGCAVLMAGVALEDQSWGAIKALY